MAARDFVYRKSTIGSEDTTLRPWDRYLKTAEGNITQVRSGMAQAYAFALGAPNIPARIVHLGTKDYVEGLDRRGTHATVEVLIDNRWVVFDPTFNVSFGRPNGKELLSIPEMKSCVEQGYSLAPIKGKTQIKGRMVEDYYLPCSKLLFAYERAGAVAGGKDCPLDAFPSVGWCA